MVTLVGQKQNYVVVFFIIKPELVNNEETEHNQFMAFYSV